MMATAHGSTSSPRAVARSGVPYPRVGRYNPHDMFRGALIGFAVAWHFAPEWGLIGVTFGMLSGKLGLGLFYAISANRNGFGGAVWHTKHLALLCVVNAISVSITYAGVHYLSYSTSTIGQIVIPALIFLSLYGTGRYLLKLAGRHSSI